jgi:hypothetical protein
MWSRNFQVVHNRGCALYRHCLGPIAIPSSDMCRWTFVAYQGNPSMGISIRIHELMAVPEYTNTVYGIESIFSLRHIYESHMGVWRTLATIFEKWCQRFYLLEEPDLDLLVHFCVLFPQLQGRTGPFFGLSESKVPPNPIPNWMAIMGIPGIPQLQVHTHVCLQSQRHLDILYQYH